MAGDRLLNDDENYLRGLLEDYGIDTTYEQRVLLLRHLDLVIEKNKTLNLTRIQDVESGIVLHILDSLLLAPACAAAPKGSYLDVGTGAGFPGIPIAIVSGRDSLLIDSVGKKVAAVSEFVDELGLSAVEAKAIRAEELARERHGAFSVVTARAVGQINTLVEYATPLLKVGGRLVVAKANLSDDEIAAGTRAAKICGLKSVSRETFELPYGMGHREVISYRKVRNPSIKLPRNTGMAQHHPLGV
jgi:16S rRNA (guanine527-N7)-methyltransferase